jgi:glutathione S-transferase
MGGKIQMPYMTDDATATAMYESDDIMAYLHANYGKEPVG